MSIDRLNLRFECLKLAVTRTSNNEQVIANAKQYENFVLEAEAKQSENVRPVAQKVAGKKKVGNLQESILD